MSQIAMRKTITSLAITFLLAAFLSVPVRAQSEAALQDARSYAEDVGVSLDEAVRRLNLQSEIGELNAQLKVQEEATFGGLYIEHEPNFRVVAKFTRSGPEILQNYLSSGGSLEDLVVPERARVSLDRLITIQQNLLSKVRTLRVRAEAGINIPAGEARVYVVNAAPVRSAVSQGLLQLPENASIVEIPALSEPEVDLYAGLSVSQCTSGFSVRNSSGTKGIITAAHCPNTQTYSGTSLPFQSEREGGSYDVQWHTAPGLTVRNLVEDGYGDPRSITSTISRSSQSVGDYVCKYGMTTGYACGYIVDKYYTRTTVPNSNTTWIRVHRDGVDLSAGGDSGGPWFITSAAYGVHSAGLGDDSIYMAVNYVSGIGVSVLTQ